jgi:AbiV family abortive infection protein
MNKLTVDDIINGMIQITLNAQSLVEEAEILYKHKYYARTYALSHFAREEMSKLFMLYKVGIEIIAGKKYDAKKLNKRFRDHKSKIQFFSIPLTLEDLNSDYVKGLNKRKNNSLYVGYEDGKWKIPKEEITEHIAKRTLDLATSYIIKLTSIYKLIQSLEEWKNAPKEEFDKAFGKIIYKSNEEIFQEFGLETSIKLMRFVDKKLVEKYDKEIKQKKEKKHKKT